MRGSLVMPLGRAAQIGLLALMLCTPAMADKAIQTATVAASDEALAALASFQAALKAGDADAAQRWLSPAVVIYESGGIEHDRAEYASHHLAADMSFLKTASVETRSRQSGGDAETAWVITASRLKGLSAKGKAFDLDSLETALLQRSADGWRIRHLHWSSREHKAEHAAPR